MVDEIKRFERERAERIEGYKSDEGLKQSGDQFVQETVRAQYSYNFSWMGRPIIQYPQDMVAMQELIWDIKPALIIETGVAHGGSLIFYASLLELIGDGEVIGIDIDIRAHNRKAIEDHPMSKRIKLIQGSSTDEDIVAQVQALAAGKGPVMVLLDSNHTHDHVLAELEMYSSMVTKDSYLVVFDTVVEDLSPNSYPDRPWGPGNNPKSAVHAFMKGTDRFVIDDDIDAKLLVSVAPSGYLRCVKD